MLKIYKAGLPPSDEYREIATFDTENKRYNGMSIYLYYNDGKIVDEKVAGLFTISDVEEVKRKSGRDGHLIRKCDIKYIYSKILNPNIDSLSNYLEDPEDYGMNDRRKSAIDNVYKKCINDIKSYVDTDKKVTSLIFSSDPIEHGGLGENGCLVPLPITNFTKKQLKFIREGKTNYIKKNDVTEKWEAHEVFGNKVEKLLEAGEAGEIIVDKEEQKVSDEDNALIESKYLNGEKIGYVKYVPSGEEMIEISYIYGPNRSGKSYYAAKYAKLWSKKFEGWPIFLFSRRDKDKILDEIGICNTEDTVTEASCESCKNSGIRGSCSPLKRVAIDERLVSEPLSMTDFENSLVIFDDIDTIVDKKICSAVQKLRDDIMETGRQRMIYVINTSHLGMNWKPTRTVLNEANSYTLFPRKGNYEHNFKILKDKMGLKTKVIKEIIEKPNGLAYKGKWGWITVYKDAPQYVIYENGVSIL